MNSALQVDELTVVADTGYQNGKQAEHCEAAGITPLVPTQKVVNPEGKEFFTRATVTRRGRTTATY